MLTTIKEKNAIFKLPILFNIQMYLQCMYSVSCTYTDVTLPSKHVFAHILRLCKHVNSEFYNTLKQQMCEQCFGVQMLHSDEVFLLRD